MKNIFLKKHYHPIGMKLPLMVDNKISIPARELKTKIERDYGETITELGDSGEYYEYDTDMKPNKPKDFTGTYIEYPNEDESICKIWYYSNGIILSVQNLNDPLPLL